MVLFRFLGAITFLYLERQTVAPFAGPRAAIRILSVFPCAKDLLVQFSRSRAQAADNVLGSFQYWPDDSWPLAIVLGTVTFLKHHIGIAFTEVRRLFK